MESHEQRHKIQSPAIDQRIVRLHYDADAGYLVIPLDSGDEPWIAASYEEGYHVFVTISKQF